MPVKRKTKNRKGNGRNGRKPIYIAVLAAVILVAAVAVMISMSQSTQLISDGTVLSSVEVREYQGERLSSVDDFRENSIKGPQHVEIEGYQLEITGLVDTPKSLAYEEVLGMPNYKKVVTLHCVEGWSATILWEGIKLEDLIEQAGPQTSANTVIFHAYDGYTSSLPLDFITENDILLAYEMNGVTLPPERGFPFQVVAEQKWGYKWVKWVTKIELSNDPDYEGYWESRGYNNDGDLSGPKFG
jgi:DMSO/TMAO reductase YedYZ molybdopterin-dependent catalytic subunit